MNLEIANTIISLTIGGLGVGLLTHWLKVKEEKTSAIFLEKRRNH